MTLFSENISVVKRPALKAFAEELDRTGVISDNFKSQLWGLCMNAVAEAYEDGRHTGYAAGRSIG